jgi:hypothetical protein
MPGMKDKSHRDRGVFSPASEELQAISAALLAEVAGWPQVSARPMFGGTMLYREQLPFAFLPRTKKMMVQDGLWLKFHTVSDARRRKLSADPHILDQVMMRESRKEGSPRWMGLVVEGPSDVQRALAWLGEAHAAARKNRQA